MTYKNQYLFYFLIRSKTERLLVEDITKNINIISCIPSVPRFRKRLSEWKKRNGPPYTGFTYICRWKQSIYLGQNNRWTYKFPISNVLIEFLSPGDYFCSLKQRDSYHLLSSFTSAIVLLKEEVGSKIWCPCSQAAWLAEWVLSGHFKVPSSSPSK